MGDRMLDFYRVKYPVSRKVAYFFIIIIYLASRIKDYALRDRLFL